MCRERSPLGPSHDWGTRSHLALDITMETTDAMHDALPPPSVSLQAASCLQQIDSRPNERLLARPSKST